MYQPTGQISPDGYWMWNGAQWVPNPYRPIAPPVVRPYESARFRATMAVIFLLLNGAAVFLGSGWDFVNISYLQTPNPDQGFTVAWGLLALADLLITWATLIPAVVFFSMWVHRVVRNMPSLGSLDPRWSPGWSVGFSFIPVISWAFPFLPVLDAWRGADERSRWLDRAARKAVGTPMLLVGWWSCWLLSALANRTAYFMERYGDTNVKIGGSIVDLVNAALLVGSAVLAIFVVRRLTDRQDRKSYMIASGQLA